MNGPGGHSGNNPSKVFFSVLGLVILLSLIPFYRAPTAAGQPMDDTVDVVFDFEGEVVKKVPVGPGDPHMVQFKGKVSITNIIPQGRQILVNLSCETDYVETGGPTLSKWKTTVTPPYLVFDPSMPEHEITVTVLANQWEYKDAMYNIIIGGRWQKNPGSSGIIKPFVLTGIAAQYSIVRLNSPHSFITGFPGEKRQYTLEISNDGNGVDWFEVRFLNEDSLKDTGFAIIRESYRTQEVKPGESINYSFEIIGPRSPVLWRSRISEISIEVSSVSAEIRGFETMSFSIFYQEKGTYYDIEPCVIIMSIISMLLILPFYLYKHIVKRHRFKQEVIRSLEEEGLL